MFLFLGSLSSSLEMIRRAHSFEVGEWNNSMAGGNFSSTKLLTKVPTTAISITSYNNRGGASSSNSSSSWQLAGPNIQYSPSRPEVFFNCYE